ncbi:hypothetical protein [Variovorax sp. LG9.2]|uniref:hypothetical protein n=1 Tax=Variovorax sp. LG9.2 TaxID=3048626 RepID=UPI002B237A6C|nr:hypothetical protein [Variovorax sp. LG9.2]MEB0056483.1 hypothetical protein [Variovorax sp. LG9.2]
MQLRADRHRFCMPASGDTVLSDNAKHRKRTVCNPDVAIRKVLRDKRHELRGRNAATNFSMTLYQHLLDASIDKVLRDHRVGWLIQQATLQTRDVRPHLMHWSGRREVCPHEFVDASLVHG